MYSVSHMISSSEKCSFMRISHLSLFLCSLIFIAFHLSHVVLLLFSSAIARFIFVAVNAHLAPLNWPIHAALRFHSASKTRNEFTAP